MNCICALLATLKIAICKLHTHVHVWCNSNEFHYTSTLYATTERVLLVFIVAVRLIFMLLFWGFSPCKILWGASTFHVLI